MTVLKSFDLKGNKQSFAGWISNLSPCDTPFISMIGKEGINEVQYSWQMDALDKPKNDGFEEGSLAVSEKREPTHIVHNFTSILRKVAQVSDTVAAMSTFGRNKEIEYQMGKAGKELKRDMEFMCLNNAEGFIGTSGGASQFSGFAALCAPEGYVDFSTGAMTHKLITVADEKGPWFKASDIFDLTYNLYLAGSKANKIMFHPCHATSFSDFISNNIESDLTYRMFDNVDNKFNAFVSKLRDPLGQKYDLIPNRFMPKDQLYIFNEADWTQMILRAPSAAKLAKKGAAERYLVETEIGLRHRHVNASGVLEMLPSTLSMEWTEKPTPLTWGLGDNPEAEITIKERDTSAPVADDTDVTWSSSNEAVLELTDTVGKTNAGKATNVLKPKLPGTSIVTVFCGDGRASYMVTVGNPNVHLRMSNSLAEKGQKVLAVVQVLKADGTPVADGTTVNFKADPSVLVELGSITADTTGASGTAQVEVTARNTIGVVQLQANVGAVKSNFAKLEIVEKVQELSMRLDQRFIVKGINDSTVAEISVIDAGGNPIPNQMVSLISTDATVVNSPNSPIDTGGSGVALVRLTAAGFGDSIISAQYQEQSIDISVNVGAPTVIVGGPGSYRVGEEFSMAVTVRRQDNSLVGSGIDVEIESVPPFTSGKLTGTTGDKGVAIVNYTSNTNSDLAVTASVGNYKSNTITIAGPDLVMGIHKAPEVLTRPVPLGGKSRVRVVMNESNGMPMKDAIITWQVGPDHIVTGSTATSTTDANGMVAMDLTSVSKGEGFVSYHCKGEGSKTTHFHVGQGTTLPFFTSPISPVVNENTAITAVLRRDEDNAPVVGADVTFTTDVTVGGFPVTVKTDSQGVATFDNFFPVAGDIVITASCPEYSHSEVVNLVVKDVDTSTDHPYTLTTFGQHVSLTHDTNKTSTITVQAKLNNVVASGVRLDVRSLDPHIALATAVDTPTNSQGKYTFTVKGMGRGTGRIQIKPKDNQGGWIEIGINVYSPTLDIAIAPTSVSSGKDIEFAAIYRDNNNDGIPGMIVRWEHPETMLAGRARIPNATTDQYGRTLYVGKGGAWATHSVCAVLTTNDAIRSPSKNVTVHM